MIVTHEIRVCGLCPVNGERDFYDVTITTTKVIKVEAIIELVGAIVWPIFQEDMTQMLADVLKCRVRSVGYHSGVKTTCEV